VKYIQKGQEPDEFIQWKTDKPKKYQSNDWKKLNPLPKKALHQALLKEQGQICCYCEQRIDKENSHIEHFIPKKGQYAQPHLTFEYTNLLCSCNGNAENTENKGLTHCGNRKADWFELKRMVSPLKKDCAEYFRYTSSGKILPTEQLEKQQAAEETINHCQLNHPILKKMRQEALKRITLHSLTDQVTHIEHTQEEISLLIKYYSQQNVKGQYTPFCTAILYFLSTYF
jgi:uncharacterized protein (TIGR02646 family)